jgi:3-hydroxyacyl-[acyl-carrier-protein] dehydratase
MPQSIADLLPACITSFSMEEINADVLTVDAKCTFPETFSGFQGHFPEKPILPAVIQLATVRCIAEKTLQHPLRVLEYSRTKFKAMIPPAEEVQIHLSLEKCETQIQGKFKITNLDQKTVASGNYVFKRDSH